MITETATVKEGGNPSSVGSIEYILMDYREANTRYDISEEGKMLYISTKSYRVTLTIEEL
jgi:hypothetical protein